MSPTSASSRTFAIPELLEQIFLWLSTRQLLMTERVDSKCLVTIHSSPTLQNQPIREAFATGGILENVHFRLTMRDVLISQRVCKGWREKVRASDVLMEKTLLRGSKLGFMGFGDKSRKSFAPLSETFHTNWGFAGDCEPTGPRSGSSLLELPQAGRKTLLSYIGWYYTSTRCGRPRLPVKPPGNPLIAFEPDPSDHLGEFQPQWWYTKVDFHHNFKVEGALSEQTASWRSMLVTQPPAKELYFADTSCRHHHIFKASDAAHSVTLGDLSRVICARSVTLRDIIGSDLMSYGGFVPGLD
ncbi:hypothetical protein MBLNU230_g0855t1 [Neophaeotheca triangularis]